MYDFVSHVLRRYFEATGWNEQNSYLNLNAASAAILDFATPPGVAFSISASPSPPFFTTYRLRALPSLQGNVGYLFASTDAGLVLGTGGSSGRVGLKRMIERFREPLVPARPSGKPELWQGGRRVDKNDYLLYGCIHVPSSRVDALWTSRLGATWQAIVSASSTPPRVPLSQQLSQLSGLADEQGGYSAATLKPTPTNLQVLLQRDTGAWFSEYSYSLDDALWGVRFLHNFPVRAAQTAQVDDAEPSASAWSAGAGLRGRFSAGAEFFFSSVEKSAGLSTGVRFATVPQEADGAQQAPTIITATLNPMMGHLSMAYAARMSRDLAACSRYDFNVYSYDSELTFGFEYWLRRGGPLAAPARTPDVDDAPAPPRRDLVPSAPQWSLRDAPAPHSVAAVSTSTSLREVELRVEPDALAAAVDSAAPPAGDAVDVAADVRAGGDAGALAASPLSAPRVPELLGLIKGRISSTTDMSLMWEGRLRSSLVSFGCRANAHRRNRPITSIGLEIMYFSTAADMDAEQR